MINANQFYQTKEGPAIPLMFLGAGEFEQAMAESDALVKNHFTNQQFCAKEGDVCLITDAEGVLLRVYLGVSKNNKAKALAHAALKCPPALYQASCPLTEKEVMEWGLAQYQFVQYKKSQQSARVLLVSAPEASSAIAWVEALFLVRDLINQPASHLGPEEMSLAVKALANAHGAEFNECLGQDLLAHNFPAIHAVGRASAKEPRLLSLSWGERAHPLVTLIGKGVCFDTGGLDIKPAQGMRLMKKDMGGAAQVLGLAKYIMSQKLAIRLQVYIPALENSIGPNAFRPGDVIQMRNALTVEVDNTDAEGRLILADALVKACEEKPALLIDFATLTGAARVAVGTDISAMFCNDDQLAKELMDASDQTLDPLWRLPLFDAYESMLKSNVADLVNCTDSPYAGAITAALFLQHFVAENQPWVHFDIMAWNLSSRPGKPEGGEAMGIRAIAAYLAKRFG